MTRLRLLPVLLALVVQEAHGFDFPWIAKPRRAVAIASFQASSTSIMLGNQVTLSWTVTGTNPTLSIDNGVGTVTGSSIAVAPIGTTTYTLTASNSKGPVTAQVTVTVVGVIAENADVLSHVYFDGAIHDSKALSWTMQGTVPQVGASGSIPAGAGPFTLANYYFHGTGVDVLDFAGDFTAIVVFKPAAAHDGVMFSDGASGTSGWSTQTVTSSSTGRTNAYRAGGGDNVLTTNGYITTAPNVICVGRAGANIVVKMNGGTYRTQAAGTITPGTTYPAYIGRYNLGSNPFNGVLYELAFYTTTPSDGVCSAHIATAKSRLGLTTEW